MSSEAIAVLTRVIRELGGEATLDDATAAVKPSVEARLSPSQAVYGRAAEGTPALINLRTYLPLLVEDAKRVLRITGATDQLARQAGVDVLTGLPDHHSMSRIFSRLGEDDIVVAIELADFMALAAGQNEDFGDELIRSFAQVLRKSTRETDHVGRMTLDRGFLVVLPRSGQKAAEQVLARIRSAWESVHPQVGFAASIAAVVPGGWRPTLRAAEKALERARESEPDRCATTIDSDYHADPARPSNGLATA